jgi:transcriptional regulator
MASADNLPLVRGTADLLVLKALSWGSRHGFAISSWLAEHSEGALAIDDSAMYQVLHRLEERELVDAEWAVTENNRRARYYRLTPQGRRYLRAETESWLERSRWVTNILTLTTTP